VLLGMRTRADHDSVGQDLCGHGAANDEQDASRQGSEVVEHCWATRHGVQCLSLPLNAVAVGREHNAHQETFLRLFGGVRLATLLVLRLGVITTEL
jgi:hypothetical protein